ncbi:LOW QUALITY PROTEIN: hypothetical protein HZS_4048 [Henneguya salminicola]|nr:LOW QUALITY PROTEIN: hypothetical protein HZS_4048 [Henneguya salminicola]
MRKFLSNWLLLEKNFVLFSTTRIGNYLSGKKGNSYSTNGVHFLPRSCSTKTICFFWKNFFLKNEVLETASYWLARLKKRGRSKQFWEFKMRPETDANLCLMAWILMILSYAAIVLSLKLTRQGHIPSGHRVDGAWILGEVERTPERKNFLVEVPDKTADTRTRTHVLPNSIIHTDCFRSYSNFNLLHHHFIVNYSENFVDPNSGECTHIIEGTRNSLKYKISQRNRTNS